jgi:hypothetical protein
MSQDDVTDELGRFFDYIWQDTRGFVYLPVEKDATWTKFMFSWPRQRNAVVRHVLKWTAQGANAFYSPAIFKAANPDKDSVLGSWVLWVDFDGNAPESWDEIDLVPDPTLRIQSSVPGNEHVYWKLDEFLADKGVLEERNRSVAYAFKADTSGWDADQILRPLFTTNYWDDRKVQRHPEVRGRAHRVEELAWTTNAVSLDDFGNLTSAKQLVANLILEGDIPDIEQVKTLAKWDSDMLKLYDESQPDDRSMALQRFAYFGAEHGWTDEQIFAALSDMAGRWGKYEGRRDRDRRLIDHINRARQKHGYTKPEDLSFAGISGAASSPVVTGENRLVYGYQDFLAHEIHIEWHLENLFAVRGLGLVTGYPGVGKTQFGLGLAKALALGIDFLGWKNLGGPKKVLVLSLEMSHAPLHHFMEVMQPADVDPEILQRNLLISPIGESLPLDKPEGQAFLNNLLGEYMPDVIFIDSLQKIMSKEMTDEQAVKDLVHYLAGVRAKHGCSMYLIHHNRKKANDSQSKGVELSDVYGSTYITTDVDFVLSLRATTHNIVVVDMLKNRLGPTTDAIELFRDDKLTYHIDMGDLVDRFRREGAQGNDNPLFGV